MSSHDDNKPTGLDAKVSGEMSQQFNIDNRLGASIAKASPEAQKQIWDHLQLSKQLSDNSTQWQKENHAGRVSKEKAYRLDRYMNNPAPRPNDPAARQNDLKIINEQSERHVTEREQTHQTNMQKEAKSYVYQILKNDREQSQAHQQDQGNFEPEQER